MKYFFIRKKKERLSKKILFSFFVFAMLLQGFVLPPERAFAAAPIDSTLIFQDSFEQTGNLLGENAWNTDNWVAVNGDRVTTESTASGTFNVGVSGNGIKLDGIDGADPDEGAQRDIATKGYASLYIEYSRAFYQNGDEPDDDNFIVSYSLDGGAFQTIATTSMSASSAHFLESATIPNPDRNTKLTLRFSVNADTNVTDQDIAGVDDVKVYGSNSPLFYDGFEASTIESGGWLTEEGPAFTTGSTEIWTDATDDGVANGKAVKFLAGNGTDPDQAIESDGAIDTTDFDNIRLRYARGFDSDATALIETFAVYYSTTTPVSWNLVETVSGADINPTSVSFALPADTFDNTNLKLRFEVNGDFSDDFASLDDVVVWGDPTTADLTVTKVIINDNGGTATTSDFALSIDGFAVVSGVASTTSAGLHTVSEVNLPGYISTISGDCAADGTITLVNGDNKNCVITNDDITPTLTVIKEVVNNNGGTATSSDFTMTVTGDNVSNSSFAGASGAGTTVSLNAGAYSVDELDFYGYSKSLSADCSGTLALGENKVCTITNDDIQPKITVTKVLITDNGGNESVSDFSLFVASTSVTSGVQIGIDAGTYTVSETGPSGYAGPVFLGHCDGAGSVTLSVGDVKECTLTNDDISPQLTVIKNVINDNGGSAPASSFTMNVTGTNLNGTGATSINFAGSATGYTLTLNANAAYSVDENNYTTHTKTIGATGCSGTLNEAETVSCTITNDDLPGTLRVKKTLINNNGGTATTSNFSFSVNAGAPSFFEIDGQNDITVNAGTYSVLETATSTYTITYNNCTNVSVTNGGTTICTVTNNDKAPSLTLVKNVINNNGGTAVAANWTVTADGATTDISGTGTVSSGTTFQAGNYTLSESVGPEGYLAGAWSCVKNAGAPVSGGTIRLNAGDVATCTITNDDQPAVLTIVKETVSGSGDGTFNFNITSTGTTTEFSTSLQIATDGGIATSTGVNLNTGSYDVLETIAGDWALLGVECIYDGQSIGQSVQSGENITVDIGDEVTCTFTNTRLGTLIVKKVLINDNAGTATTSSFSFQVNGGEPISFESDGQNNLTVENGTYSITEPSVAGYTTTYENCTEVSVPSGGEATCTITNNDIALPPEEPAPQTGGGGGGFGNGPIFGTPFSFGGGSAAGPTGAGTTGGATAGTGVSDTGGTGGGFLSIIPEFFGFGGGSSNSGGGSEVAIVEEETGGPEINPDEIVSEEDNSDQTAAVAGAGFFSNLLGNWIFWLVLAILGLLLIWFFTRDRDEE